MAEQCNNTAALREALECLLSAVRDYHENAIRYVGKDMLQVLAGPINRAQYALSEPPRNCDRNHTVEEAFAACHEDRGYLSDPVAERRSTISFMLSVAQKAPKFEKCEGDTAPTEGDKHGV